MLGVCYGACNTPNVFHLTQGRLVVPDLFGRPKWAIGGGPASVQQILYHALKSHFSTVIGAVNAADAVMVQFTHFVGQDGAAAATKNFDVAAATPIQQIFYVLKKLYMATLVAGDGNAMHIFFNSRFNNVFSTAVVAKVDYFGTLALQNAAHDVNGCIMPIKQAGGSNQPYLFVGVRLHVERQLSRKNTGLPAAPKSCSG
jgi:succinate dehydrogenase hydrophobic anchor subunit